MHLVIKRGIYMNNKMNYIIAVLLDNLGSSLTTFVLSLYILDLTKSNIHLSLISMLSSLPFLFLGLPFGALIDSMNLKKVLHFSDLIRAILYFILACISFKSTNSVTLLFAIYIVTTITSCVNVFNTIAETTFIPEIVGEDELYKMNSTIFGMQYLASLVIPLIGGFLYSYKIVPIIFLGNSLTYLISAIFIYDIQYSYSKQKEKFLIKTFYKDIFYGVQYVVKNKEVGLILVIIAIFNFLTVNFENDVLVFFKLYNKYTNTSIGSV